MNIIILTLLLICLIFTVSFLFIFMFWYNGVLEVNTDEHGDDLKLNINEYDMIRNKRFMILLIKRNNKV